MHTYAYICRWLQLQILNKNILLDKRSNIKTESKILMIYQLEKGANCIWERQLKRALTMALGFAIRRSRASRVKLKRSATAGSGLNISTVKVGISSQLARWRGNRQLFQTREKRSMFCSSWQLTWARQVYVCKIDEKNGT